MRHPQNPAGARMRHPGSMDGRRGKFPHFILRENHHPLFQGNHSYTFLKHTLAFALRRYLAEGPYLADNTGDVGDAANGRSQGVWRVGCI